MKRVLRWALIIIILVFACVASGLVGAALSTNLSVATYSVTYTDFISILLTAIAVILTALAIFLAVLGVIGWRAISTTVEKRAVSFLEDGFEEGNSLHIMMNKEAASAMYRAVQPVENEEDEEGDYSG